MRASLSVPTGLEHTWTRSQPSSLVCSDSVAHVSGSSVGVISAPPQNSTKMSHAEAAESAWTPYRSTVSARRQLHSKEPSAKRLHDDAVVSATRALTPAAISITMGRPRHLHVTRVVIARAHGHAGVVTDLDRILAAQVRCRDARVGTLDARDFVDLLRLGRTEAAPTPRRKARALIGIQAYWARG